MTPIRVIPTLPDKYEGSSVEWARWELAPILSHVPSGCDTCDHEGPLSLAWGTCVLGPVRIRRLLAVRCRRCQETRVSTFRPYQNPRVVSRRVHYDLVPEEVVEQVVFGERVEVAYFPPQAIGEDL